MTDPCQPWQIALEKKDISNSRKLTPDYRMYASISRYTREQGRFALSSPRSGSSQKKKSTHTMLISVKHCRVWICCPHKGRNGLGGTEQMCFSMSKCLRLTGKTFHRSFNFFSHNTILFNSSNLRIIALFNSNFNYKLFNL